MRVTLIVLTQVCSCRFCHASSSLFINNTGMSPPRTRPGRSRQQGAKVGATRSGSKGSKSSPRSHRSHHSPRSSRSPSRTGAATASASPRVGASEHGREKRGLRESGRGSGAMPTLGDMVREEAAEEEREKTRHFGESGLPSWGQVKSHAAATARRTRGGAKGGARAPQNVEEQLRTAIGSIQRTIRRVTASRRGVRKRTAT